MSEKVYGCLTFDHRSYSTVFDVRIYLSISSVYNLLVCVESSNTEKKKNKSKTKYKSWATQLRKGIAAERCVRQKIRYIHFVPHNSLRSSHAYLFIHFCSRMKKANQDWTVFGLMVFCGLTEHESVAFEACVQLILTSPSPSFPLVLHQLSKYYQLLDNKCTAHSIVNRRTHSPGILERKKKND